MVRQASGSPAFEPIRQERTAAVRIAEQILGRITSGMFPIGATLPGEMELSRQFGVSRPTIREALGALQFAGYIDSVRGSGTRVIGQDAAVSSAPQRDLSVSDILELFEARLVLEPQVAALAAMDPDLQALDAAESLVRGMELVVDEPSLHALTDLRVHAALARACRNSLLTEATIRLLDMAGTPILAAARNRAWSDDDLPHAWADHHQTVVTAIRHRDPAAAAEGAWRHLSSAASNMLLALDDVVPVDRAAVAHLEQFISQGPVAGVPRMNPLPTPITRRRSSGDQTQASTTRSAQTKGNGRP